MLSAIAPPSSGRRYRAGDDGPPPPVSLFALAHRAAAMGDEVEAFLEGRLVEHLLATGRAVPAWTVLNKVAHATVEDLVDLVESSNAAAGDGSSRDEPVWRRAQRSLAAELLDGATTPDEVIETQRGLLIPLELWLIERSKSETITSRRVIEIASETLVDHPPGR